MELQVSKNNQRDGFKKMGGTITPILYLFYFILVKECIKGYLLIVLFCWIHIYLRQ